MPLMRSLTERKETVTWRELEVLWAFTCRDGQAGAAEFLHISPSTVKGHLANVRRKLNVSTTVAAVWLMRRDLEAVERVLG